MSRRPLVSTALGVLVGATLMGMAGSVGVRGAGVPWKAGAGGAPAVAPATAEEVKADLGEARFQRLIKPIEAKIALAKKAMEPYEKEMEKPPDKRRPELLKRCKVRAAQMYMGAALAAKRARLSLSKTAHQAFFAETYEKPNRQKAVDLLLELALQARSEGNLREAVFLYRQVLAADPENAEAKTAMKDLYQQYQQAMRDRATRSRSTGGGEGKTKNPWDWDRDADYKRDWGDWRNYAGRGSDWRDYVGDGGGKWW